MTAIQRVGDINADGKVNCDDLAILKQDYGTTNSRSDLNGDGTVNVYDLSILISNFDQGVTYPS